MCAGQFGVASGRKTGSRRGGDCVDGPISGGLFREHRTVILRTLGTAVVPWTRGQSAADTATGA